MLVLLRMVIGLHFFAEGMDHIADRTWSSEGFLRQAKGPLGPLYQAVVPEFHRFDDIMHGDRSEEANAELTDEQRAKRPGTVLGETWQKEIEQAWAGYRDQFVANYHLDEKQKKQVDEVLERRKSQLAEWIAGNAAAFNDHVNEWRRMREAQARRGSEAVPFMKKRVADQIAALRQEAGPWPAQARKIERSYRTELDTLLTDEQRQLGQLDAPKSALEKIDAGMKYGITAIGACLLLGLLTRTAAVAGSLFLLSVVASQPFWVTGAQPTYYQTVELVALAALAMTHVGRWVGLDFFVHHLIVERSSSTGENF